MRKRIVVALAVLLSVMAIMWAEYRFIMLNLCPYIGENNTVCVEIFNRVDEYDAPLVSEME